MRPEQDPTTSPAWSSAPLANPYRRMEIGINGPHRRTARIEGVQRYPRLRRPPHQDVALYPDQDRRNSSPGRATLRAECLSLTWFAARYRVRQRSAFHIAFHAPSLRTMRYQG